MEESLAQLIESVEPGASSSLSGLDELLLETKYIPALEPNPQLVRLFYRRVVKKEGNPKASVVIAHGFAESSNKYVEMMAVLALAGYDVHMLDQRNAGYSGGCRAGHDLYDLVRDVNKLVQQTRSDLPCFIWGHSMGGLITTYMLMTNPMLRVAGAVVTAPAYRMTIPLPQFTGYLIAVLGSCKELMVNLPLPLSSLSRNDVFLKALAMDKLNRPVAGFPYMASVFEVTGFVAANTNALKCPVLFMHGDKDVLVSHRATEELYQRCGSTDKTLKIYPGGYHELHHDTDKEKFKLDLLDWLDSRIATARPIGSVGKLRVQTATPSSKRSWKLWAALLLLVYLAGVLLFRSKATTKVVRWIAFTLVPKAAWPVFLPLSYLVGKR